eukprot:380348-Rhodomonas_salina.1
MKVKGGPLVSNAKRIEQQHITVEKRNFGPRSALMAPPIIFQQRAKVSADLAPPRAVSFPDRALDMRHVEPSIAHSTCAMSNPARNASTPACVHESEGTAWCECAR